MRPLAAVPLAFALLAAAPAVAQEFGPARPVTVREFVLKYDIRVKDVPKGATSVRVWLPMPMSTALQEVSNPRIAPAEAPIRFVTDDPYGTRFLVIDVPPPPDGGRPRRSPSPSRSSARDTGATRRSPARGAASRPSAGWRPIPGRRSTGRSPRPRARRSATRPIPWPGRAASTTRCGPG